MNSDMRKDIRDLHKNLKAIQFLVNHEPHDVLKLAIPGYVDLSHRILRSIENYCSEDSPLVASERHGRRV